MNYDHTEAFQAAFGVQDARWFLGKAERELARYLAADDSDSRVDCLLNFANSVIALEDWALPEDEADEGAWRGSLRAESPAHAFIALIALVAKHRRLRDRRFAHLRFENGLIQIWTEDPKVDQTLEYITRVAPSARVRGIRTHIDDDQIEGYTVTIEIDGLMYTGSLVPVEQVMSEALSFWKYRLSV